MPGQQGLGLGQQDRLDAVAHVVAVPLGEHVHFGAAEDFQAEVQVGGVVELASQVVLVELVVAGLVGHWIEVALFAQIVAPGVIAVAAQEGVVQVE